MCLLKWHRWLKPQGWIQRISNLKFGITWLCLKRLLLLIFCYSQLYNSVTAQHYATQYRFLYSIDSQSRHDSADTWVIDNSNLTRRLRWKRQKRRHRHRRRRRRFQLKGNGSQENLSVKSDLISTRNKNFFLRQKRRLKIKINGSEEKWRLDRPFWFSFSSSLFFILVSCSNLFYSFLWQFGFKLSHEEYFSVVFRQVTC